MYKQIKKMMQWNIENINSYDYNQTEMNKIDLLLNY